MNKELNFLSIPDHVNKFLCVNYNQKLNLKSNLSFRFQVTSNSNVSYGIKSIYLLEMLFPRKAFCLKINKKKNTASIFFFDLKLTGYEFISMIRFFGYNPFYVSDIKNLEYVPLLNKKLKNFEFKLKLKLVSSNLNKSFSFLKNYHFD